MKTFREAIQAVSAFLSVSISTETGTPLVQRLHEAIPTTWSPPNDSPSQQTILILYCLDLLREVHSAALTERWQLGIKDWRQVNALIEIIIVLGLYKALAPGVGVPEARRIKSIFLARESRQDTLLAEEKALLLQAIVSQWRAIVEEGGEIGETLRKKYLVEQVSGMADLAFNPVFSLEQRLTAKSDFDMFISSLPLSSILATFTAMLHSQTPTWLRIPLTRKLSSIPMQKERNGMKVVVQILLGKHQEPTISQLDHIAKVIGSIPSWVTPNDYIDNIAPQVLELLDEKDSLLSTSATHIISFLFFQHTELVCRYILSPIQSPLLPKQNASKTSSGELLSTDEAVQHSLKRLESISSDPTPTLLTALLRPILFTLFLLSVYIHRTHHTVIRAQVNRLLNTYIISSSSPTLGILDLTKDITLSTETDGWSFAAGETGGIAIREMSDVKEDIGLENIQTRVEVILEIIEKASEEVKSEVFVGTIRHWLHPESKDNLMSVFANAMLLQEFMTRYQEELMKAPIAIIQVCVEILSHSLDRRKDPQPTPSKLQLDDIVKKDEDEEEDNDDNSIVDMAMTLLSAVTADSIQREVPSTELSALETCLPILEKLSLKDPTPTRRNQARNIISFIRARIALTRPSTEQPPTTDEDAYKQAMEYISDPLVPIRAQGISILRDLILRKSSAVDIDGVLETLVGTLQDDDSYVYLNSIKSIRSLAEIHGDRLLNVVMEKYESPKLATDVRLRLAEVLAGLIQQMNRLFSGAIAQSTISRILHLISVEKDWRVRVSGIGLLSVCVEISPIFAEPVIEMALHLFRVNDLTFGEEGEDAAPLRRGAVTVIGAALRGGGVDALGRFTRDVVRSLRYLARSDRDETVRELAQGVLSMLGGAIEDSSLERTTDPTSRWKIL